MKEKFEKAIEPYLYHEGAAKDVTESLYAIHKEECIRFAEWINRENTPYAPTYDKLWCTNEKDDITAAQLFDLFNEDKTIKL